MRSNRSMDTDDEPNIVTSGKSRKVTVDGLPFSIEIYRLECDTTWTLEVVDIDNTSHVWEIDFASDLAAHDTALAAIKSAGATAFMRGSNVIPFPR